MTVSKFALSIAALVSSAVVAGGAAAQSSSSPMSKSDGEWIMVTGNISNVTPQGFVIDYGDGRVPVEMDGFLPTTTQGLMNGDWVTVSGRIDDSLWERRSIEASSVYSSRMQERLWANASDEEGDYNLVSLIDLPDEGEWIGLTGKVVSVDPAEREVIVDVGALNVQVDVTGLGGPVLATTGDWVSVYGQLDDADLWDAREIDASSVVILRQAST